LKFVQFQYVKPVQRIAADVCKDSTRWSFHSGSWYTGFMEKRKSNPVEVELATLEPRYQHTRMSRPKLADMLTNSMERFGQIKPVVAIPEEQLLVLIDGYLRKDVLLRLGRDTILVDIQEISETQALLELLGRTGERQWEAVEQAWIIRDLKDRFGYSLREIARGLGCDVSWVSRRLSLIESLPDELLRSVCAGVVSTHSATRVLLPLARANKDHAERLTQHLAKCPMSTRELTEFFKHYEVSNKQIRERLIADPSLFVKARKSRVASNSTETLQQGPEGSWAKDFEIVKNVLRRAQRRIPIVIYPEQDEADRTQLLWVFNDAKAVMDEVEKKIEQVITNGR
jgi:ParB family transcriptional regulator, chromosome partitioning protein